MEDHEESMTCECPNGHRLRGSVKLIGKSIRCPRCNEKFVFGYYIRQTVSDTAVMRILGDPPSPPPAPEPSDENATRPCDKCGVEVSSNATVCKHCNTYLGKLPDFFAKLRSSSKPSFN